jgi:hypothetical protein
LRAQRKYFGPGRKRLHEVRLGKNSLAPEFPDRLHINGSKIRLLAQEIDFHHLMQLTQQLDAHRSGQPHSEFGFIQRIKSE